MANNTTTNDPRGMALHRKPHGFVDPKTNQFFPQGDLSSAVASAAAHADRTGSPVKIATKTGNGVKTHGTVRPASNPIFRGK